jgi:hypothetical protein
VSWTVRRAAVFDEGGLVGTTRSFPQLRPGSPPKWGEVGGCPFPAYRRLDLLSKLACLTVEVAGLDGLGADPVALVFGSAWGCLDADVAFQASLAPGREVRPALFPYTLPSTCLGELAILHGLRGPSLCLSLEPEEEAPVVEEAAAYLAGGEAQAAVLLWGEALGPAAARAAGLERAQAGFAVAVVEAGRGGLIDLEALRRTPQPVQALAERLRAGGLG